MAKDETLSPEFKAILATREQQTTAEVERAFRDWPLVTALTFLRLFRLRYPHTSTSPQDLERLINAEMKRKELIVLQ